MQPPQLRSLRPVFVFVCFDSKGKGLYASKTPACLAAKASLRSGPQENLRILQSYEASDWMVPMVPFAVSFRA